MVLVFAAAATALRLVLRGAQLNGHHHGAGLLLRCENTLFCTIGRVDMNELAVSTERSTRRSLEYCGVVHSVDNADFLKQLILYLNVM